MTEFVQIITTCDDRSVLEAIARSLVENSLAACVQIGGPLQSIYSWQNKVETAQEWMAIIKSTSQRANEIVDAVKRQHPYDEPEILVTQIAGGSSGYLDWLAQTVA